MLFNSISFALFLPIVLALYWFAAKGNRRLQNILLLVSSYYFYSCWNWKFLFLLVFSCLLDYASGIKIHEAKGRNEKLRWLWLSIGLNVGFLGVFKYYNFFVVSFAEGLSLLGIESGFRTLSVILPVGISFYTFHGLSYVIDIYKDRVKPERSFIDYSVFVCFFPLLVAGPIERATHLLPQIVRDRAFSYSKSVDGLRQILWGLFKKIVIADNSARYADMIFGNSANYSGYTLLVGALLFTVQIYCDFSGYSDIAIGTAKLFGIDLLRNFAFPYFSKSIAEFWRRWHISLSSWFRDYLYIPLGGSHGKLWLKVRNVLIIFLVSGFWHGANWTFIAWGLLNAIYIMPSVLLGTNRGSAASEDRGELIPTIKGLLSMVVTFSLTVFTWILFRVDSVGAAIHYISTIFSKSTWTVPSEVQVPWSLVFLIAVFFAIEWLGRRNQYALGSIGMSLSSPVRWSLYYAIVLVTFFFQESNRTFIYFQF
jgi:D-alanyl-lipoteichoic acid acyltransferase DltB (MBOAT superfamily)